MKFNESDNLRINTYYVIIDKLKVEFQQRKEAYLEVNELFGFLHKLRIDDVNVVEEIRKKSGNLIEKYADLESELIEECIHFQELILDMSKRYTENDLDQASSTPLQCFKFIKSKKLLISLFPNLETALRMYLTIISANASERANSMLKRIKTYLRNSIGEDK